METWSLIRNVGVGFILPPGLNIALMLLAFGLLVLPSRRALRRLGAGCLFLSVMLLYAFSAPIAANRMIDAVQSRAPAALTNAKIAELAAHKPDAVVLLTGGVVTNAPEYEGPHRPSDASWVRLLYAEDLALRIGVALLISGKGPIDRRNEAETTERYVWRLPKSRVLVESISTNTREAAKAIRIAHPSYRRVILVSDALHLLRGTPVFVAAGFDVIPAPTRFVEVELRTPASFIPSAAKLAESRAALHAGIGYLIGL